ncbi:glycosyltransferase, partial [Candidatus Woesearchaeota archaeon]
MPQTRVSVIIITYNEEHTVPRLLRALAQQTYEDFETIVVDSNSTDATERVARKAGR